MRVGRPPPIRNWNFENVFDQLLVSRARLQCHWHPLHASAPFTVQGSHAYTDTHKKGGPLFSPAREVLVVGGRKSLNFSRNATTCSSSSPVLMVRAARCSRCRLHGAVGTHPGVAQPEARPGAQPAEGCVWRQEIRQFPRIRHHYPGRAGV